MPADANVPTVIVIGRKYGQLGNRLLLFAHWIAFATEHGLTLSNPAFEDYAEFFVGTHRNVVSRFPAPARRLGGHWSQRGAYAAVFAARHARIVGRVLPLVDCPDGQHVYLDDADAVRAITRHRLVVVTGFGFRCEELVQRHGDVIRGFLAPAERWARKVAEVRDAARRDVDVLVGVHMRRGDFRTFNNGRWCYDDATYARFMHETRALFPDRRVAFLLVSNEPIDRAAFKDFDVRFSTDHLVEDMYALAECDRIVAPPSTFASWASFHGRVPIFVATSASRTIAEDAFEVHHCPVP